MTLADIIQANFNASHQAQSQTLQKHMSSIALASQLLTHAIINGGKVLSCGNGGSANLAELFSSKMLNNFQLPRPGLPAMTLSSQASVITAIANANDYEQVFARQVSSLGQSEDILLVLTTSGNSGNLVSAIDTAHERNMKILALTGNTGGEVAARLDQEDIEIRVESESAPHIQETHLIILHCLGELVDSQLLGG